ncbi:MAG TPA: S9 family peptidase [Vicinamibacterales bacterium]|nr:S9 family peptidase [Vicinamibacterales bacterium]
MVRRFLHAIAAAAAVLMLSVSGIAQHSAAALTVDDLMTLRSIVDVQISPDGSRVAYVVSTPNLAKNEHEPAVYVVPVSGGTPARLGASVRIFNIPSPRPQLRWTADSETVSVLGFADGRPQVFAIPAGDGPERQITAAPEGVFGYEWSPDGTSIAFLTADPIPQDEQRRRADKSFVIRADAPDRATRLVVQRTGQPSAIRLLTPPAQYVDALSWSPDGHEIAFSAAPRTGFSAAYDARIFTVSLDTGAVRTLVDRAGMNTGPRFSPDGRSIAFISTSGRSDIMASRSLTIVAASGGAPRVHNLDDAWVNEYVWTPDSRSIVVQANDGTFGRGAHMFEQAIVRVDAASGHATRLDSGATAAFSLSMSRDGRRLAYKRVEARTMGDVAVLDTANGRATSIAEVNPALRESATGVLKPVSWRSFDGMEIWGLLLTPSTAPAGRRLPLLTYVHGGPGGGFTYGLFPQFMHIVPQVDPYPTAAMAGAGYAVLFPMPRGGAGYGEAGQRAIVNAWGEADYKDIMAGVDALVAQGIADPDRLGVMGASYGGYMTNWIVTQTGRFKAASAGASLSDLADTFYLSEGGAFMADYFKRPWENRDGYAAHSPLTFADRVTTPLLIQHGESDPRVPIAGAWKFYRTLKALGKTVELEIYPRGGHVLREPMQQREQMRRNLEWFARWIPLSREPRN